MRYFPDVAVGVLEMCRTETPFPVDGLFDELHTLRDQFPMDRIHILAAVN